jgi:RNA-directed DNA polymerase
MKESYGEGLATHTGPESCGATRKGGVEALTGERAGRVFSRVSNLLRDADAVRRSGRQHPRRRYREAPRSPARSETPRTHGSTSHGNREIPCPSAAVSAGDRVGKSKDKRR